MNFWSRFKLVGNSKAATVAIYAFIIVLAISAVRCSTVKAAELDLRTGVSFPYGGPAAVLGMDLHLPQGNNLDIVAGTTLWAGNNMAASNWDWHLGFQTCRWDLCGYLGAAFVQRIDAINGSHTNFSLGLSYMLPYKRMHSVGVFHLSNAGTTEVNRGRNVAYVDWKLQ